MASRKYYSTRRGAGGAPQPITLPQLRRLVYAVYTQFREKGFFHESMGYDCVDRRRPTGTMGESPESYAYLKLRRYGLWPPDSAKDYSETDLFDQIEFMHDHVSKPMDWDYHGYSECGFHSSRWDSNSGRQEFREQMNQVLADYGKGYELSDLGEVLERGDEGMDVLLKADLPSVVPISVVARVTSAVLAFRRRDANEEDRRNVVRTLASVLEHLRPLLKQALTKQDEADLFELANRFGIRHLRADQKTAYDPVVWLPWMFYYYLAAIHASTRLIEKAGLTIPILPGSHSASPPSSEHVSSSAS